MIFTEAEISNLQSGIDKKTANYLSANSGLETHILFDLANKFRQKFRGNSIDLCSIVNAKSGACSEDCAFCAQSAHSNTHAKVYPLVDKEEIKRVAESAREKGVKRFCVVTSGKKPSDDELNQICSFISVIRETGLMPCATLGFLAVEQLKRLKDAGLHRYHHNLETSEFFFSEICSTHTYKDKIRTIESAVSLGLSVCSGGIFGLGESWEDRIDMAFALKDIGVDSIPINLFTPIAGTALGDRELLNPMEALKIIAIYRLILPECEIRVCGGRPAALKEKNSQIFFAGADGILLGNYLTTSGRDPDDDLKMIKEMGFEIA
jgi:biotin synthase